MTARTASSRPAPGGLPDEALATLRASLIAGLALQQRLALEHQVTADELTGEVDVDSVQGRQRADVARARAAEAVVEIGEAIGRIDLGTYGSCERCGVQIAFERLEAIPYARSCVRCPAAPRRRVA